jgi:hypothetical protein
MESLPCMKDDIVAYSRGQRDTSYWTKIQKIIAMERELSPRWDSNPQPSDELFEVNKSQML